MARLFALVILLLLAGGVSAQEMTPRPPILQVENETASAVAWSPDGTMLAVGDSTGVLLYTENLEFIRQFEQPSEDMKALAWSPDGKYIAAIGANDVAPTERGDLDNPEIYVWEADTGELVTTFDEHGFLVTAIAWSPDGSRIASGGWEGNIRVWNPSNGELILVFSPESETLFPYIISIAWSPDGQQLTALAEAVGVYVWNANSGSLVRFIPNQHPYYPHPILVAWSPDGEMLATGYGIIDLKTWTESNFENCPASGSVHWHPYRHLLALLGNSTVSICDVASDEVIAVLEGGVGELEALVGFAHSLDWHPDGQQLAGAARDGFVRIWRVFDD